MIVLVGFEAFADLSKIGFGFGVLSFDPSGLETAKADDRENTKDGHYYKKLD